MSSTLRQIIVTSRNDMAIQDTNLKSITLILRDNNSQAVTSFRNDFLEMNRFAATIFATELKFH